jgi:hypothetical protein
MLGLLAPFVVFRRVAPENVGPLTLFLVERREILGRMSGLCQVLQPGATTTVLCG